MTENSFFESVYDLVARIPSGRVMTYGQIARVLQSPYSAKLVGFALSAAPRGRDLPCHRVLNRKGEMAPGLVFGGARVQRALLMDEGAPFLPDGRVNLALALFDPEEDV